MGVYARVAGDKAGLGRGRALPKRAQCPECDKKGVFTPDRSRWPGPARLTASVWRECQYCLRSWGSELSWTIAKERAERRRAGTEKPNHAHDATVPKQAAAVESETPERRQQPPVSRFNVVADVRGTPMCVGRVCRGEAGWRFYPNFQAEVSRKAWPTAEAALKGRVKNYVLEPSG